MTMYAPIAERAIPYEQYTSRDGDHIYSAARVTPRNAPSASRVTTIDSTDAELRQFSREPTVISLSADGDAGTTASVAAASRPSAGGELAAARSAAPGITSGFDSNTLKRMLQTLPEVSSPVDLMQEFEEEFADVVGPTEDDVKPLLPPVSVPPPFPPVADNLQPMPSGILTADPDRSADASPADAPEVTVPTSHVEDDRTDGENAISRQTAPPIQLNDIPPASVALSGKSRHAVHVALW